MTIRRAGYPMGTMIPDRSDFIGAKMLIKHRPQFIPAHDMAVLQSTIIHYEQRSRMSIKELELARQLINAEI